MNALSRFLEFAVSRRVITRDEASQLQRRFPHFIGLNAVNRGYLSYGKVTEILEHQKVHGGTFGEVARSMNLLSEAQIETVLADQRTQIELIGRALIGDRKVTMREFRALLEEFEAVSEEPLAN